MSTIFSMDFIVTGVILIILLTVIFMVISHFLKK